MSGLLIPIALIVAGVVAAAMTYRGIRRGGARFYTLERELILRRANVTLGLTVLFFAGAIALLFFQRQQLITELNPPEIEPSAEQAGGEVISPTTTPFLEQFPPTETPTPLFQEPTVEPTPELCRAAVEGTGGNGLKMRDAPQGAELVVLPEGTLLTVLENDATESGGIRWRLVRAVGGEEGWVAEDFLTIRGVCGEP